MDQSLSESFHCSNCLEYYNKSSQDPLFECVRFAHQGVFICQLCATFHIHGHRDEIVCKGCVDNMRRDRIPHIAVKPNEPITPYEMPDSIYFDEQEFKKFSNYFCTHWKQSLVFQKRNYSHVLEELNCLNGKSDLTKILKSKRGLQVMRLFALR